MKEDDGDITSSDMKEDDGYITSSDAHTAFPTSIQGPVNRASVW